MKAIFIGGLLDKYRKNVSEDDQNFTFMINKCDTFPSRGYQQKWEYKLRCVVNIGEPIAYFQHYTKPVFAAPLRENGDLRSSLQGIAQQQTAGDRYIGLGLGVFGL